MSDIEYASRKETLDAYLAENEWDSSRFLGWLRSRPEGTPAPPLNEESKYDKPTPVGMARSAAKAGVGFVLDGLKTVERAEHERRIVVCSACQDLVGGRCKRCGCYMTLKAWLPKQHCPKGAW